MNTAKLTSLLAIACLFASMPLVATGCTSGPGGGGEDGAGGSGEEEEKEEEEEEGEAEGNGPSSSGPGAGAGAECSGDEMQCSGSDLDVCEDGQFETYSCDAGCEELYGFSSDSCAGDECQCDGEPTNAACAEGVSGFCACAEWAGSSCADADYGNFYVSCHQGDNPLISCFAGYVSGGQIDCEAAIAGCS